MEKSVTKENKLIVVWLLISLVLFFVMVIGVKTGSILGFDTAVQDLIQGMKSSAWLSFFEAVSTLGTTKVIGGGSLLFLIWLWFFKRNYWAMAIFAVGVGGGNLLNKFVKNSVARERPIGSLEAESLSYSFPSGHAMVGVVFYGLLAYFITEELKLKSIKWTLGIAASLIMLLMGVSRIGLNAHYTSDVIAGYALGTAWMLVCVYISNRYFHNC